MGSNTWGGARTRQLRGPNNSNILSGTVADLFPKSTATYHPTLIAFTIFRNCIIFQEFVVCYLFPNNSKKQGQHQETRETVVTHIFFVKSGNEQPGARRGRCLRAWSSNTLPPPPGDGRDDVCWRLGGEKDVVAYEVISHLRSGWVQTEKCRRSQLQRSHPQGMHAAILDALKNFHTTRKLPKKQNCRHGIKNANRVPQPKTPIRPYPASSSSAGPRGAS